MNEAEIKLQKVKKSCGVARKVSKVLEIILLVSGILCIIGAIICFAYRGQIDSEIADSAKVFETGKDVAFNMQFTGVSVFSFDATDFINEGKYGLVSAISCLMGGIICIVVAIIFTLIKKIFATIIEADTPFSDIVLRKIRRLFIFISIYALVTMGIGFGGICALIGWSIYTILDYGYTLQTQVDETL